MNDSIRASARTTVDDLFRAQARLRPEHVAIDDGNIRRTYAELDDRVSRLSAMLHSRGVRRGDPVAVLSENRPEYLEVVLAAARIGAAVAGQNWRLSAREISEALDLVDPNLIIVSARHAALLDAADHVPPRIVLGPNYEDLLTAHHRPVPRVELDPEDPLLVIYTSGTTGRAKGAMVSHRAEIYRNLVTRAEFGIAADDAFVAWTPLFHMGAADNALGTLMAGGTVIVVDGYDAERLVSVVREQRIGWLLLMPGMVAGFADQLETTGVRPAGVRVCGVMADLVGPHDIARVTRALDAPYANTFGSTETGCPPCSAGLIPVGEVPVQLAKTQSAYCDVRIVDAGTDAPDGIPGELWMRGPTMFSGYWGDDVVNERDFAGGWFHMGDLMVRRDDGTLDFVDRAKYLIKSGGENIYPAEIERVLLRDPRVLEAVVVRRPDSRWGEVPVAFVIADDPSLDSSALADLCRADLASFKRPKEFVILSDTAFPRNVTGKVDRSMLETWAPVPQGAPS